MDKFIKIVTIFSLFGGLNSQTCVNPPQMSNFNFAAYADGTTPWYTIAGKSTMSTPLTGGCSKVMCGNNGTHLMCDATALVNGASQSMPIVAQRIGSTGGTFYWSLPSITAGIVTVNDLKFTYQVMCYTSSYAAIYIYGTLNTIMTVNMVMIHSRTPTLSDTLFRQAVACFPTGRCKLGSADWAMVDQSNCA